MKAKDTIIEELLSRGVEEVIEKKDLERKLRSGKRLRVKFGIDPTGDKIHIGHAVVYWKLKAFQDLGHQIIILIGDYTAMIGDSSDKEAERQRLTHDAVKQNMKNYLKMIGSIIDLEKAEIRYNSEWLKKLSFIDVLDLAAEFKVAQMIERDNFRQRFENGKPIGLHEFLYPIMQGYDSVALHADIELGGNDQLFNLMAGRVLQKRSGQEPQNILTTELLVGSDGKKMSKTAPNCVFVNDDPVEMYGKIMAVNDEFIPHYFKLATDVEMDIIETIEVDLANNANPRDTKASLARAIVGRYYGSKAAVSAEEAWEKQFRAGEMPTDIEDYRADIKEIADPIGLIANAFSVTKSEVRRLIDQGGIKLDGAVISSVEDFHIKTGSIIQLGKRRFKKIVV
ncbi:tyrosine--tRNA ligase [Candidatus Saccharibacteria bacterium]|nr:tyrosine--tRNA ligase [Candidatus Saccharibacteria bacterium]